jgi:chromosomal replication initiator protein
LAGADQLWKSCSEQLRQQVSQGAWETCFEAVRPVLLEDNTFVLSVPNSLAKDRIENRHLGLLETVCQGFAGQPLEIVLQVAADAEPSAASSPETLEAPGAAATAAAGAAHAAAPSAMNPAGLENWALNPRYTFEAFVTGPSNRFAHAAALAVAEKPATSWNPLFIYGDAGLGKTHLLHAICHYLHQNYPEMKVRYFTSEAFVNAFIESIRTNTQSAFKQRFRKCDVLLVDDIQFLERKEGTQEEFFHTFNALYEDNHQIVISSDRAPKLLGTLEDRLRSRFEWGLTTDVHPPELETRVAILRTKAEREPLSVPDDVLEYIAANITDNIRELEGALIRVCAFASLSHTPVTLDIAQEQLSDLISSESRQLTPRVILDATAELFGLSVDDICGKSRSRPLVTARQVGMYVFRQMTDFSYPAIGREFGGRDHTTVMHAVDKISTQMKQKRQIYDQVRTLMARLGSQG